MTTRVVPDDVRKVFEENDKFFPTQIQKFQFYDKYSRFSQEFKRRETWTETVDRSVAYLKELSQNKLPVEDYKKIRDFILHMKSAPSMRLLAMAGSAARRTNIAIYNCSYLPIDSIQSYVEALLISMSGCGVGYSVEHQYVDQLPEVQMQTGEILPAFQIPDTTEGWCDAVKIGFETWFSGKNIQFDYSQIRLAGVALKIKGGRASGPEPLQNLLDFSRRKILTRQGKKLRPIDAHDIMCMIGYAAVSGGVRRTAMISLFDFEDQDMLRSKNGDLDKEWQRWNANNSAVWPVGGLNQQQIAEQFIDMARGGRGEPGIFSRENASKLKPERRKDAIWGTNPCGEINLRPFGFCNLSIAIARPDDTEETLKGKIEVATIIGTIQSMATNFPGLRDVWRKNCEEERLLGVDINGWRDCPILQETNTELPQILARLRKHAIETNKKYADILGIAQSASVTCVKPSGNSGLLFNSASGLHARWAPYYVRNVRVQAASPIKKVLQDCGVPMSPENGQTPDNAITWVIHFPIKSPEGSVCRKDKTAIQQCDYWLVAKKYWTEHNPSVTINYKPEEFVDLLSWITAHKDWTGGLSFLPTDDSRYSQMPLEEISKEEYEQRIKEFPNIDFSLLWKYESNDMTEASNEIACSNGACDLADYYASKTQLSSTASLIL